MKRLYTLLIMLFVAVAGWSQTTSWTNGLGNNRWDLAGNWSNGVPATNYFVVISSNTPVVITSVGGGADLTLNGLRVEGNSTVTFQNSTSNRNIYIRNGNAAATDFVVEAGSSLTLSGASGGNGVNIGLIDNTTGTATASIAGDFRVNAGRTYDTDNNNTSTSVTGTIENTGTVNGGFDELVFESGSVYLHARNGGVIPTANWNNNATCEVTGITNTQPTGVAQAFGHFTWNCPNQLSSSISFVGFLTNIDGNFTVESTGTGALNMMISGGSYTLNLDGSYIQNGGTMVLHSANSATWNILGNFTLTGGTFTRLGGTCNINFAGNGAQSFTKTGGTISSIINFAVSATSDLNFGTSVLDGSTGTFTLASGATLITSHPQGLRSTGAFGSVQVSGTRTYSDGASYEFRGASTGNFATTGNAVANLTINNASGQVMLDRDMVVNGVLALTNGYITTSATNELLVSNSGSSTSANGAFVNGPLQKSRSNNGNFVFYVGTVAKGLHPIGFNVTAGTATTSTFTAQYYSASGSDALGAAHVAALQRVSDCEYWTLTRSGGNKTGTVNIGWTANSACNGDDEYVTELSTLRVARHDGTQWQNMGGAVDLGSTVGAGAITASTTAFGPFALATTSSTENPLPVLFADVKAYGKNNGVQIEWSNLTEKDVVKYEVERSATGQNYVAIKNTLPTSNQNDKASYTHFDAAPLSGVNFYRIKVTEVDGKVVYSKVLRVETGLVKSGFNVYPNPVVGRQMTITLTNLKQGQYTMRIVSATGQDVHRQVISNVGTGVTQQIDLPASIKPGMYTTVITGDNYRESKIFVVQ